MANEVKLLISIQRSNPFPEKSFWADSFAINAIEGDENSVEVIFGDRFGGPSERIIFSGVFLKMTHGPFATYFANFPIPNAPVGKASRHLAPATGYTVACHVVPSRIVNYAETVFEQFSVADWVAQTRSQLESKSQVRKKDDSVVIPSIARIAVYTPLDLQVQFLYDLVAKLGINQ